MSDLTTRLHDANEGPLYTEQRRNAIRDVLNFHAEVPQPPVTSTCDTCESEEQSVDWPCDTVMAIARALGVENKED